jgi:hypothetical protein
LVIAHHEKYHPVAFTVNILAELVSTVVEGTKFDIYGNLIFAPKTVPP